MENRASQGARQRWRGLSVAVLASGMAAKAHGSPTFTVDVAQSDDKLRRITARMTIKDGSGEKGTIALSIQLKDVDKPVTITPPASGRPLEELMQKLQQDFGASVPEETTIS